MIIVVFPKSTQPSLSFELDWPWVWQKIKLYKLTYLNDKLAVLRTSNVTKFTLFVYAYILLFSLSWMHFKYIRSSQLQTLHVRNHVQAYSITIFLRRHQPRQHSMIKCDGDEWTIINQMVNTDHQICSHLAMYIMQGYPEFLNTTIVLWINVNYILILILMAFMGGTRPRWNADILHIFLIGWRPSSFLMFIFSIVYIALQLVFQNFIDIKYCINIFI